MSAWLLLRCDCCGRCVFLVSANYSFLIFQWAEVVGPLLRLRNNHGPVPLRPGTVRLSIAGYGVIKMYRLILFITSRTLDWLRVYLRVEVDNDMLTLMTRSRSVPPTALLTTEPPACTRCEDAPDVRLGALQATRLLFGPRPPGATVEAPVEGGREVASLLASWCPLPMYWAKQDGI
jgi:hypothetical protein